MKLHDTILCIITILTILSMQAHLRNFFCYLFNSKGHKTTQEETTFNTPFNSIGSTHIILHSVLFAAFLQFCKPEEDKNILQPKAQYEMGQINILYICLLVLIMCFYLWRMVQDGGKTNVQTQ